MKNGIKSKTRKTSDVRGWRALDNVTSRFSTMLEPIASASFLSSLPIIHAFRASSEHILLVPWSFFLSRWLQCSSGVAKKLPKIQKVASEISEYFYLVYTKTVDSVFRALWLPTQSVNILHYSLIHQFLRASDAKLAWVASKMPSRFAAVSNKEISQLIKQAAPEIHEEGDKVRFRSFNG